MLRKLTNTEIRLRKEIEPQLDVAKNRYQEILDLILAYTDYCDKNGDEDFSEYKKPDNKLHQMTGKDMSQFNFWEWWEEEGAENRQYLQCFFYFYTKIIMNYFRIIYSN